MTQAVLRPITIPEPTPQGTAPGPGRDDRDALRAIAADLDIIGKDPDGCAWALVRTTPELLAYLATFDAGTENDEDSDDDGGGNYDLQGRNVSEDHEIDDPAEDNGDFENDQCDDQPCFHGTIAGVTY